MKIDSKILIGAVFLWCGAIVLAPALHSVGGYAGFVSSFLYKFFHTICHQFESRSFHVFGYPFAVCERCTSIYFSFLIGLLAVNFSSKIRSIQFSPRVIIGLLIIPMVLDVAASWISRYEPNTFSRIITGSWFGFGISILLSDSLSETISFIRSSLSFKSYGIKSR